MPNCLFCSQELPKGARSSRKYCSNRCQVDLRQKKLVDDWLKTGVAAIGSHAEHYIKTYLHQEQKSCCAICSIVSEWNGCQLIFVLDHIDGNSDNNERGNLRLVCPNCDSQLPTFKSRNKGSGRYVRRERYHQGLSY